MNQLEQLRTMTTVVADTGDIESIAAFRPTDATTNPSLLLKAAQKADYAHLLDDALAGETVIRESNATRRSWTGWPSTSARKS